MSSRAPFSFLIWTLTLSLGSHAVTRSTTKLHRLSAVPTPSSSSAPSQRHPHRRLVHGSASQRPSYHTRKLPPLRSPHIAVDRGIMAAVDGREAMVPGEESERAWTCLSSKGCRVH